MVFDAFAETAKGRLSAQYRSGRILTLIPHGPHPGWAASTGPQGWLWPERGARRTQGEPTLWDAGNGND